MKLFKNINFILALVVALMFFACDTDDGPDAIYAYFTEQTVTLKEDNVGATDIQLKVFTTENLTDNVEITYSIEGGGR